MDDDREDRPKQISKVYLSLDQNMTIAKREIEHNFIVMDRILTHARAVEERLRAVEDELARLKSG